MSDIEYLYPLYPWKKDWSQRYLYQWHLTENGEFKEYGFGPADVRKTLEQIRKMDNVTRGIPKVIILCSWQTYVEGRATWDTQFPSFTETSDDFIDKSIGETPEDAIRWLMAEAKKYNTDVTFHVNYALAQEHSPLWQEYEKLDLFCRNADGKIRDYAPHWEGRVNLQKEFDAGLFQKRVAAFIDTYPEIINTGFLHNDWNGIEDSPYHGFTKDDDVAALRRCMAWIRETYNIDTSCEIIAAGGREEYDYGMQCMSLSFCRHDDVVNVDLMKVPAYIFCGGDAGDIQVERYNGKLTLSDYHQLFGSSIQGEGGDAYCEDNFKGGVINNNLFRDFCYGTLTWYYLNRLLRISFDPDAKRVCYSDGVISYIENGDLYITKDGEFIRQGTDIFIPALWKSKHKEIMAWSDNGYAAKEWRLPKGWGSCESVDLYNNRLGGVSFRENLPVDDGWLTLSLDKCDGVIIVPHGADINAQEPAFAATGTAEFMGTAADGEYGKAGYVLPEDSILHSPVKSVGIIGGQLGEKVALHQIVSVKAEDSVLVSIYLHDRDKQNCQVMLDVIDGDCNERIGESVLLNNYENGVYATYKISGHVRFRLTRFHFKHFGRGDGRDEAGPLYIAGVFFDKN
jgi:hypothetical protein